MLHHLTRLRKLSRGTVNPIEQDRLRALRSDLQQFLEQYRNCPILFYPNPGNGGNSIITAGTFQSFSRCGAFVLPIGLDGPVDGQTVFLGGGGNFVPLYDHIKSAYARFLGRATKIILLPHTIRGHEDTLSRLDERCVVFCRDTESYDHVRSKNPAIDVRLAHDMAFHLNVRELLASSELQKVAEPIWRSKLAEAGLHEEAIRTRPIINFSRLDAESRDKTPKSDADISFLFMLGTGPQNAPLAAWCLLKTISIAQHIRTDRLHVAIGAALLGTPCELRDNSYGKNAAVYRQSLEGRFPSLRFMPT